jgi:hypothetical protein
MVLERPKIIFGKLQVVVDLPADGKRGQPGTFETFRRTMKWSARGETGNEQTTVKRMRLSRAEPRMIYKVRQK